MRAFRDDERRLDRPDAAEVRRRLDQALGGVRLSPVGQALAAWRSQDGAAASGETVSGETS
ncbi:MAG: hypothetical protein LBL92_06320, partial [Propionibacteriaceae bacterium]|nr:hypothetical protein [Propionibacteriaceae bacterium]